MTTTELRELDALISEKLMGATLALDPGFGTGDGDERHTVRFSKEQGWIACPEYTTDPALAMMVLEKCLRKRGQEISIETTHLGEPVTGGEFHVATAYDFATAETLPLAICLFAKELFK